jgi:hypothetical protein
MRGKKKCDREKESDVMWCDVYSTSLICPFPLYFLLLYRSFLHYNVLLNLSLLQLFICFHSLLLSLFKPLSLYPYLFPFLFSTLSPSSPLNLPGRYSSAPLHTWIHLLYARLHSALHLLPHYPVWWDYPIKGTWTVSLCVCVILFTSIPQNISSQKYNKFSFLL